MNKKGFTLVELLAVMVILLAISVVTVTSVTATLKRTKDNEKETQIKKAINAAKIYFSMNDGKSCVTKYYLVNDKYLTCDDIDKLDQYFSIKLESDDYIYKKDETTSSYCGYASVDPCTSATGSGGSGSSGGKPGSLVIPDQRD